MDPLSIRYEAMLYIVTYSISISGINISSTIDKFSHSVHIKISNCHMQGGPLIERIKQVVSYKMHFCDHGVDLAVFRPIGREGFEEVRSNPPFDLQKILYTT